MTDDKSPPRIVPIPGTTGLSLPPPNNDMGHDWFFKLTPHPADEPVTVTAHDGTALGEVQPGDTRYAVLANWESLSWRERLWWWLLGRKGEWPRWKLL